MAFFGLLLYIVCIYMRPGSWIPAFKNIQLMDIIVILTIIFWVSSLLFSKKSLVKAPQNRFMILFLFALVVSRLSHFYFGGAITAFFDFSRTVIMFFLVVNILDSLKKFKIAINLIIYLTLILAIQGIMQYKSGFGWAGQPLIQGRITWIGIFNDPNDLALAFVIIIPFILNSILGPSTVSHKIISLPILGVLLYAIYLTNSRGGILALSAVFFSYFLFYFKRKKHLIMGILVSMFFVAVLFIHSPSRMSKLSPQEDSSAYGRIEAWYAGIKMLKTSPLFGIGYGKFDDYHFRTAHNSIIFCAAETGLLGLFLWIGLFYFCFRDLTNLQKVKLNSSPKTDGIESYALALHIGIIGFLVSAFFLTRTFITLPYLMIAFSVSLFHIGQGICEKLENKIRFGDLRNIGLFSLLGLILSYLIMKLTI